jgi:hypothetical protein
MDNRPCKYGTPARRWEYAGNIERYSLADELYGAFGWLTAMFALLRSQARPVMPERWARPFSFPVGSG